jgi:hypothetical protein
VLPRQPQSAPISRYLAWLAWGLGLACAALALVLVLRLVWGQLWHAEVREGEREALTLGERVARVVRGELTELALGHAGAPRERRADVETEPAAEASAPA